MTRRIPLPALSLATLVAFAIGCAHGVDPVDPDAIGGTGGTGFGSGSISGTGDIPNGTGATVSSSGGTGSSSGGASPSTGAAPSSGGGNSPGTGGGSSGGPSGGGTSGGGAAGAAGTGAGGVVVDPVLPGDVVVQYFSAENGTGITNIKPHFNIVNRGKKLVPLAQLTLRYWYTADGPTSGTYQELQLDYAEVTRLTGGGTKVKMSVAAVTPPQPNADTYIEIGFTGTDSIGPGKVDVDKNALLATKQIEVAAHWPGYTTKYDQSNDYSYAAKTAFVDWPKVTLYQNGVLIWGTEPDGTMPSGVGAGDAGGPPSPSDAGRD